MTTAFSLRRKIHTRAEENHKKEARQLLHLRKPRASERDKSTRFLPMRLREEMLAAAQTASNNKLIVLMGVKALKSFAREMVKEI
jgi:hypothetical protein